MTRETSHITIAMGQLAVVTWKIAPRLIVLPHRLCITRFLAVVARAWRNRVGGLHDAPPAARHDQRILDDVATFQLNVFAVLIFLCAIAIDALKDWQFSSSFIPRGKATNKISPDGRFAL